jgi:hypothetical protein
VLSEAAEREGRLVVTYENANYKRLPCRRQWKIIDSCTCFKTSCTLVRITHFDKFQANLVDLLSQRRIGTSSVAKDLASPTMHVNFSTKEQNTSCATFYVKAHVVFLTIGLDSELL